jgi:hypothetical protein
MCSHTYLSTCRTINKGQLVSSRSNFDKFGSSSSNQTLSVLGKRPDQMVDSELDLKSVDEPEIGQTRQRVYDNQLADNKIIFTRLAGKKESLAMGEPKSVTLSGISAGRVKIVYRENEWQRHFKINQIIDGFQFNEHFGTEIISSDFNNDGLEGI